MNKNLLFLSCFAIAVLSNTYASTAQTKPAPSKKPAVSTAKKPAAKPSSSNSASADIEAGKALIAKSDCLSCHRLTEKLIGPAYSEVAKKYPPTAANIELLSSKIIKGGAGVWGQIPMAPHAALQAAEAKKMVKYILSIKS